MLLGFVKFNGEFSLHLFFSGELEFEVVMSETSYCDFRSL